MPRLAVICAMKCRMWRGFQKHRYDMQSDSILFIANRLQFFHNLWKNLKGKIFHSLWKDYTPICFQYLGGIIAISLTNVPMIQVRLCSMYAKHWKMAGAGIGGYVVACNHILRKEGRDNPTIGLLICKQKSNTLAQYALESSSQPLGISEYELEKLYPEKIEGTMPSIKEIEASLDYQTNC